VPDRAARWGLSDERLADGHTVYELEKAGAFKPGVAQGVSFTTERVAAGAAELRDEIVLAWRASESAEVGYQPEIAVSDVEAGKVDPYDSLYGDD